VSKNRNSIKLGNAIIGDSDDKAEITYALSQTIELGGKHSLEKKIVALETDAMMWDHEIGKLDLQLELTHAFIDAAVAQEKMKLAEEQCNLAEESLNCAKERFSHGKTSALDQKKSMINHCCKTIAASKARKSFEIAKKKLAIKWGMEEVDFNSISYPFYTVSSLPDFQELESSLEFSPEFSKGMLGRLAAETATQLEHANQYPDLEVSAGISTERGCHSPTFFVELALPLPIFDRNEGNISRAVFQEWQALYSQENLISSLKSNLANSYSEWQAAYEASKMLEEVAKASADEHVRDTQEGYEKGKFEKFDVLEAKKASLEVKDQYIDALAEYHHSKADTLRLVGNQPTQLKNEPEE
jgi:outer membrane protein, heavy metal efflux system